MLELETGVKANSWEIYFMHPPTQLVEDISQ
jgi:hypothetical protein